MCCSLFIHGQRSQEFNLSLCSVTILFCNSRGYLPFIQLITQLLAPCQPLTGQGRLWLKAALEVVSMDSLTVSTGFHLKILKCSGNIKKKKKKNPPNCPELCVWEKMFCHLPKRKLSKKLFNSHYPTDSHIHAWSQWIN